MSIPKNLVPCACLVLVLLTFVDAEKYRICIVDGKGHFKKSGYYCPTLDKPDSKVECVVGLDRLDCLRRISKGTADFSVFTPEDLVTASNSGIEVLVTNELRYTKDTHEYEVVAVIDDGSDIRSRHDLKGKRYCHPGYGYETDWTRILANYFESTVVPQLCDPKLTITENRIKATSEFFEESCKAGPWVNNPDLDTQLKNKYPNLCQLCDHPTRCSMQDKYWGRRGPLYCLTDGAGDISWARLDDVKIHFGLLPGGKEASPNNYKLLCPDDTIMPINSTNPCVWVVKPWPVIATKRIKAQDIQELISSITHDVAGSWQSALLDLIETYHSNIKSVEPVEPIETYLDKATGFLSANSFSGCHPPRTINICVTSIIEHAKCSWLRESAAVYGIEPDLECIKADNTSHCMIALETGHADVVMVPPDMVNKGLRQHNLRILFYETVNNNDKYITVAVAKSDSSANTIEDLVGKKACFPSYDGVAWNTILNFLNEQDLLSSCKWDDAMAHFFGPSCVPNLPRKDLASLQENCGKDFSGDFGAIKCLTTGQGDVAFVSKNSLNKFLEDPLLNPGNQLTQTDLKILCEGNSKSCHLSWAPIGYGLVRKNSSELWVKDTLDVFLQLDNLFGKNFKSLTSPFTMFGKYDGKSDLLFHDATVKLRDNPASRVTDTMTGSYDDILRNSIKCSRSSAVKAMFDSIILLFAILLFIKMNVYA